MKIREMAPYTESGRERERERGAEKENENENENKKSERTNGEVKSC